MTTFPTEFSALPTVNGSTKVLADDGTNNGTATVAQIVANAGPDTRIPTSGNTAGNVPAFTSTGGQLGASPISVAGSSIVINSDGNAAFVFRGITNPNNNIYVGYDSAGNYGRIQAITEGTALRPLALNPDGGNVGIGTTSPGAKLELAGGLDAVYNANLLITSSADATSKIAFNPNGVSSAGIGDVSGGLVFYANGANTERMRIDGNGNVGVGTTSPGAKLHIESANVQPSLRIEDSRLLAQGLGGELYLAGRYGSSRGSGEGVYTRIAAYKENATNEDYAYAMTFSTHPCPGSLTEGMRISSAGLVGIGTASPEATAHIKSATGDVGSASGLIIEGTGTGARKWQINPTAADTLQVGIPGVIRVMAYKADGSVFMGGFSNPAGTGAKFCFDGPTGKTGINTDAPTVMLDINSDTTRLRSSRTPASASAAGNAGDMCWDGDFLYVCVSTNQWKRAALSTW